ncbi:hypothetical protein BT93_B2709 [Corymbia citriodora subsp. variegata]|nr:hypothetical protein BT93_B2709 [Corymbia citriodora subsp. variegata]
MRRTTTERFRTPWSQSARQPKQKPRPRKEQSLDGFGMPLWNRDRWKTEARVQVFLYFARSSACEHCSPSLH